MGATPEQERQPNQSGSGIRSAQTGPGTYQAAAQVLNSPASQKALEQWDTDKNGRYTSAPAQQPKVVQAIQTFIGTGADAKIELFESERTGAFKNTNDKSYISGAIVQNGSRSTFLIEYPIRTDSTPAYILQGEKLWKNAGGDSRRDEILQGERRDVPTDLSSPKNSAILKSWDQPNADQNKQNGLRREIAHQLSLPEGYSVNLHYTDSRGAEEKHGNTSLVRGNVYKAGVKEPVAEFTLQYGKGVETKVDLTNKATRQGYSATNPLSHDGGRAAQVTAVQRLLEGR